MFTKEMFKRRNLFFLITAVFFVFSQSKLSAQPEEAEPQDVFNKFDTYLRYMPSRSVEAMPGDVEIFETLSEYSHEVKLFDKLPVKFSLENQYIGIEDTVGVELPAHLIGLAVGIETTLPFFNFDEIYLRIGFKPSFYTDDWDFEASALRLPSRFFIIRWPNTKWTFLAGLAIYPDFENEILPILGFIYKPNDKLTFEITPQRPNISYLVNDKVLLFAEAAGALNSEFEVSRGGSENVVLKYKQMHLGAGAKLKLNKFIQSSVTAGAVFNRSLKYRDNQGKVNIKDGLYTEFRLEIEF